MSNFYSIEALVKHMNSQIPKVKCEIAAEYAYDCMSENDYDSAEEFDIELTIESAFQMLIEAGAKFSYAKASSLARKYCNDYIKNWVEERKTNH